MRAIKLLVAAMVVLAPAVAVAAITGSPHDFQSKTWNTSGQICLPCHTPHNASTTVADSPLWNHTVTTSTFTLYTGTGTLDATDVGQPDGVSKLCLSCHDGTVALDAFGTTPGNTTFISGDENLGTDLSNDHPISFTYDDTLATTDGELNPPSSTTATGLGGTIQQKMLFSDKMECASCHDVHNTNVAADPLLRIDSAASALCLTCHAK